MAATLFISDLVETAAGLKTPDFETFLNEVFKKRAQSKKLALSEEESALLKKIYQKLPESVLKRAEILSQKNVEGSISSAEHEELLGLVELIEHHDAEKISNLTRLARLRGMSLREMMKNLGILPLKSGEK